MLIHSPWLKKLNLKNKNKLHFIHRYLLSKNIIPYPNSIQDYPEDQIVRDIEFYFNNTYSSNTERLDRATYLDELYTSTSISEKNFDWIDENNPRQCYYIWASIRLISIAKEGAINVQDIIVDVTRRPTLFHKKEYEKYILIKNPGNGPECREYIINFFHMWNIPQRLKTDYLDCLKDNWRNANQFKHKIFKHLNPDNLEHTKWFWNYLVDTAGVPCWFLSPVTDSEYLHCARAIFDIWPESSAEKTLTLNRAYSSFHSKKFKLKPEKERGANVWLGADEMNQLTEIAGKKGISVKLMLKRLINSEFIKNSN